MVTNFKEKDLIMMGMKVPKKAKKKVKISGLKNRVWAVASRVFRKLDAIERGDGDMVKCCTCERVLPWTEMDGGHFAAGKHNSVKYEKDDVHCQCKYCNRNQHGQLAEYTIFMMNHYGKERTEQLLALKHVPKQFSEDELRELLVKFRAMAVELHV